MTASFAWPRSPVSPDFQRIKYRISYYTLCFKTCSTWWFNASAQATGILFCWLRFRIRRGVTRRYRTQHEWRPRLFNTWYFRVTPHHSGRIKQFSSRFGPLQNKGSALWITASDVEPSWNKCNNITLQKETNTGMYYSMDGDLVYCSNNQELMEALQLEHNGGFSLIHQRLVWRQCYSTMEIHSRLSHWLRQFVWKKCTRTFRFCCKKICYEEHWWNICVDLKVTAMLTELQGG